MLSTSVHIREMLRDSRGNYIDSRRGLLKLAALGGIGAAIIRRSQQKRRNDEHCRAKSRSNKRRSRHFGSHIIAAQPPSLSQGISMITIRENELQLLSITIIF